MPSPMVMPSCLIDWCKVIYPKLDFDRIKFFRGLPFGFGGQGGTVQTFGSKIHIFLEESYADNLCQRDMYLAVVHELVHAQQIQDMPDGGRTPGLWLSYYLTHQICGGSVCKNKLEKEAYDFVDPSPRNCGGVGKVRNFIESTLKDNDPCVCGTPLWPTKYNDGLFQGSYAEAWEHYDGPHKDATEVGSALCIFAIPFTLIIGTLSSFFFSGGSGASVGTVIGVILGVILGLGGGILGILLGAWLGGLIGGAIGAVIDTVSGWFSGPSNAIWFTAFKDDDWLIPDAPVTSGDKIKTSKGPALAVLGSSLHAVYRGAGTSDIYHTTCEASTGWKKTDTKISKNGRTRTTDEPALASLNNKLYLAYREGENNHISYNVFENGAWRDEDKKITVGSRNMTSKGPALAVFRGKLYIAYKGATNSNIYYNVYDEALDAWEPSDINISTPTHTLTSDSPALAVYNDKLYMAYRSAQNNNIYYNEFDGTNWLTVDKRVGQGSFTQTGLAPALGVGGTSLYMAYRAPGSADIWYNVFDGTDWLAEDRKITTDGKVKTGRRPALHEFGSYLFMVYRDNS